MKNQVRFYLATACSVLAIVLTPFTLYGQRGVATGPSTQSVSVNNMSLQESAILCGGKAQQGTPIAALGTSEGSLTISGIPATASVFKANLFWSVLTNDTASSPGASITFNGTGVTGTNIGKAPESPCFPQSATIAYKADVTSLVKAASSTGNGTYTVAGFPGSP